MWANPFETPAPSTRATFAPRCAGRTLPYPTPGSTEEGPPSFRGGEPRGDHPLQDGLRGPCRFDDRIAAGQPRSDGGGEGAAGAVGVDAPRLAGRAEKRHAALLENDVDSPFSFPGEVPPLEDDGRAGGGGEVPRSEDGFSERADLPVQDLLDLGEVGGEDPGPAKQLPIGRKRVAGEERATRGCAQDRVEDHGQAGILPREGKDRLRCRAG